MACDVGTNIVIVKADFGRDKYSSVCGDSYFDGNCTSRVETETILKNLCSNKQTCDVIANAVTFQDNCPDQKKVFKVWYQCVGTGNLGLLIEVANKKIIRLFRQVLTSGGNANGKPCRFPFKYNNIEHYQCIYEDYEYFNNQKWCRTNDDSISILEWGNCPCKYLSFYPNFFFPATHVPIQ